MRKNPKKRYGMVAWTAYILVAVMVLLGGYSIAKYVTRQESEPVMVAKNFYFYSDMLRNPTEGIPQYTLQTGADTVSITLMNYPDGLRTSQVDISCVVTLTGEEVEQEQTLTLDKNVQDQKTVEFSDLAPGTYMVTAVATEPYTQTLKAYFTVVGGSEEISYNVSDASGSPNLKLTVTTAEFSGSVTISWPEGVLPDNTDPLLENASGNSCTVTLEKYSEYTFQFFKTDPSQDHTQNITVS